MDPVSLEVYRHRLTALCEEMGATLGRAACSPNIKERRDYSCALFDPAGAMVAQAAHIPVHLGAMPLSVAAVMEAFEAAPGEVYLVNDPFRGGSHLPDWTVVAPVYGEQSLLGWVANRAHHADVGGARPGSMGAATEIYAEGLRIPPVRLVRDGAVDADLLAILLANTRTPDERQGDLDAQLAALRAGQLRLLEIVADDGPQLLAEAMQALPEYTARILRQTIADMPDGTYRFEDQLESGPATIRVELTIAGDAATIDLRACDGQVASPINAVRAVTIAAVGYCFACLLPNETPQNQGCFAPLEVLTKPGTVVDATPPAAVAAGNVECSQRIVDVVFGALAQALPDRIPAASQGTMNNLLIGGIGLDGKPFAYYETIGGGGGARPDQDGLSGRQVHMTNTLNTPIEALELSYPLRVTEYALREGSGGDGLHRGGDGLVREIEALVPCEATLLAERRETQPYGLAGGKPGAPGADCVIRADGTTERLSGHGSVHLEPGDRIRIETPGGGGWGGRE